MTKRKQGDPDKLGEPNCTTCGGKVKNGNCTNPWCASKK